MKKLLAIIVAASSVASFSTLANHNAGSIDLSVSGRIDPAACELDIAGGGNIDYGVILPETLSFSDGLFGGRLAQLPVKETSFTIRCSSNAAVKLSAISKRLGTTAGATENTEGFAPLPISLLGLSAGNTSNGVAGLGRTETGVNIGGYIVRYKTNSLNVSTLDDKNEFVTLTGSEVENIYFNSVNKEWKQSGGNLFSNNMKLFTSFAKKGEVVPLEAAIFDGVLEVQAYINQEAATLGKTTPVILDGLSTIELNYI